MVTASREQQELLLEVQELINRAEQLRRHRQDLNADEDVEQAQNDVKQARAERDDEARSLDHLNQDIANLEESVAVLAADIERDEEQLLAGTSPPETLDDLQRHVEVLRARRSGLEEELVEAMETREEQRADVDAAERVLQGAEKEHDAAQASVQRASAVLDQQIEETEAARAQSAGRLDPRLRELFESLVDRHGVGAARLRDGISGATGLPLSPTELAEISQTPEETLVFCPQTGAILVRE